MKLRNAHLRSVPYLMVFSVSLLIFLYVVNFDRNAIIICLLGAIIAFGPVILLHLEYLSIKSADSIHLSKDGIRIKTGSTEEFIDYQDLKEIVIFRSRASEPGGIIQLPTEYYFYVKLVLKRSGENARIFTSLNGDVDFTQFKYVTAVPVIYSYTFFASIRWPWVLRKVKVN